ncbi:EAL domain-containing protein [Desulfitobacterium sp.]|uniref:bifunctional diguanylate cyclase/phosphodiesterase n=1 Tax=Desulfitobacterium sp. TaxID=49981 RepID=UPI002B2038B7|nr:EAL domain-containing protein [Desulfitobacterium sp.]MEA4900453.1 EAL domain-containing protein [Desulfitobacterium sp.]
MKVKTYNFKYEGNESLKQYLRNNDIVKHSNILIQLFSGIDQKEFIEEVIRNLVSLIPQAKIIGATTAGEILNNNMLDKSCLISISVFEKTKIKTLVLKDETADFDKGVKIARQLISRNTKVIISFADVTIDGQDFLDGINAINDSIIIAGGIAGKSHIPDNSYVFTENGVEKDAVVAAALESDTLFVSNGSTFNWVPIGREHIITEANGRIIKSIDHISAQEFYNKYIHPNSSEEIEHTREQFPLMIKRNSGYAGRPVLSYLNGTEILISSRIEVGEKIRIGFGDLNRVLEGSLETFKKITENPGESLFIYSCAARKHFLKKRALIELLPLNDDSQTGGFYTYGEFININSDNIFHTETMSMLLLSEDINARIKINKELDYNSHYINDGYSTLYNFLKTIGEELHQLNLTLEEKVEEKTRELEKKYHTDELTGLNNRSKLLIDLAEGKYDKLAIIDIKSFNDINDFYGNMVGDAVLKDFAKLLDLYCKKVGLNSYRLYSDLFAVIDNEKSSHEFIETIRFLQNVIHNQCLFYEEGKIYLGVTIGVALREESLFENAEMALHYAKKNKKAFQIYNETLNIYKDIKENIEWTKKIKEAISGNRIVPFFQPIVDNRLRTVCKYEALIRILGEDGEIIPPYFFLEIAKKAGLYKGLTIKMLEKTFEVINRTGYEISINLAIQDIESQEIRELIIGKLEKAKSPHNIVFEIVESEGIEDFNEVRMFIKEIKKYGSKIAIDDFGTGYSNFSYLMKLNVDYIKIDGSIIKNIHRDKSAEVITKTIVAFAKELGIATIAEFVAEEEIYDKITQLNVDYSQGYYFSKPVQENQLELYT